MLCKIYVMKRKILCKVSKNYLDNSFIFFNLTLHNII